MFSSPNIKAQIGHDRHTLSH